MKHSEAATQTIKKSLKTLWHCLHLSTRIEAIYLCHVQTNDSVEGEQTNATNAIHYYILSHIIAKFKQRLLCTDFSVAPVLIIFY